MKQTLLFAALLCLAVLPVSAQRKERFNPDLTWNTVRAGWGVRIPMGSDLAPDGEAFSLNYTRRFANHWGWRTGFEYLPENTSVTGCVGLPVSLVFRTYTVGFKTGVQTALLNSAADVVWDGVMGYGPEQMRQDVVANFLFILFRRAEFFAGLTPGYIFGEGTDPGSVYGLSDGTQTTSYLQSIQLNRRFSLTADAGATVSIPSGASAWTSPPPSTTWSPTISANTTRKSPPPPALPSVTRSSSPSVGSSPSTSA